MNINELASKYANTHGGDIVPPCTGLTSDALSEVLKPMMVENSDTGVSTRNALSATHPPLHSTFQTDNSHWYALRTTYGREKKAYDYIISKGGTAFYPTLSTVKLVDGKRKTVEESRIPNLFFAYGTEEEIKSFVYDNVNLHYLRFYYRGESVKYLLIIEGQASNDGFTGNFDLSYQRALSLYRYFQINRHLDLKRQNCEVLVCGSGTEGALRAYPDNASNTKNQRFLIHILPKPGVIN